MKWELIYCFLIIILLPQQSFAISSVPRDVTLLATETTIKVDWIGDADADGYFIYRGMSSENLDQRVTIDDSISEYTITGLDPGTTYYVAVSSFDNSFESDLSPTESITTSSDMEVPSTPTGLKVPGVNSITQSTVFLIWDENDETDLDHYNIYFNRSPGAYDNLLEADKAATSLTVADLANSVRYYFTISAVDASGNESDKAEELIVDTLVDSRPPNSPKGITGELTDNRGITVTIQDGNSQMADFTGNILFYGNQSENLNNQVDLGNSFSFVLSDLPKDSTWYFSALSYDFSGNESAPTIEISVLVEDTLRFLNQPDEFDGGCFISAADRPSGSYMEILLLCVLVVILSKGINHISKPIKILLLAGILIFPFVGISHADMLDELGNNVIGVSVGYYIPSDSQLDEFYGDDTFPLYGFYERRFFKYFSIDLESGFLKKNGNLLTESGDKTGIDTRITLVPVSSSLNFNFEISPYIIGYIGVGPDYWYCQEETPNEVEHPDIDEWVGGYHGKAGVKLHNTDGTFKGTGVLLESSYSRIDRFGDNDTDIGGWAFKFGIFYQY
jgi:hypothetical protein